MQQCTAWHGRAQGRRRQAGKAVHGRALRGSPAQEPSTSPAGGHAVCVCCRRPHRHAMPCRRTRHAARQRIGRITALRVLVWAAPLVGSRRGLQGADERKEVCYAPAQANKQTSSTARPYTHAQSPLARRVCAESMRGERDECASCDAKETTGAAWAVDGPECATRSLLANVMTEIRHCRVLPCRVVSSTTSDTSGSLSRPPVWLAATYGLTHTSARRS